MEQHLIVGLSNTELMCRKQRHLCQKWQKCLRDVKGSTMLTALLQEEELFKHLLSPPSPHSFLHAAPRPPPVFPRHVSTWQTTFVNWNPACIWAQPIKFHHVKLLLFLGSMKWTTWLISIIKWMDGARERVSRWWMPYGLQTSEEHMSNYGTWVINEHE